MEKFEWRMLDNGSCTIRGKKEKRIQNEVNQINMVQGTGKSLDGKTIWSKILITIVAKREINEMKLNFAPNHRIIEGWNPIET
jgi:hypothetical protein